PAHGPLQPDAADRPRDLRELRGAGHPAQLLGGCLLGRAGGARAGRGVRPGVPARAAARAAGPGAHRASAPEGEPGASVTHTAPVAERPSVRLSCAPLTATSTASENGVPGRTSSTVPITMPR